MGLARSTLIITVACAALGAIVLLVIVYRIVSSCRPSRTSPLPPIQPLSHEREYQRARFEASRSRSAAFLAPSPSYGSPSPGGSKTSLLGSFQSPRASYITTTAEGAEELSNSSPLDPAASIPVPGMPGMPASSSSLNLSSSPSPLRQSSRPGREDPHRRRPKSPSLSRGLPHSRHSQVQIVLPAPLGTNMLPSSHRQSMYELDAARDRMSIVDRWVPTGRDSSEKSASRPRRVGSNPNTTSEIGGCQADDRSRPPPSFAMSGHGETEGNNAGGRGRRLTRRDGA